MSLNDVIEQIRNEEPPQGVTSNPFKLESRIDEPASLGEIEEAWGAYGIPQDAIDLWNVCREARLFEDVEYGQWGLALLSPAASLERTLQERALRPEDVGSDDIVIGKFLGDQELLVLASGETGNRRILIALPLDDRADWFGAASDLHSFLESYFASDGEKYWES
jgi:hypothetical protein